jgi:hypothetical protein
MVDLRRQCGIERCQRGYFNETPPAERVDQLVSFYGLDKLNWS